MAQRTRPVAAKAKPGAPGDTRGPRRGARRQRRTRFDAPPPRPFALSGWALLPLRAFLGVTFCFAGLQKLANPNFLNANSPSSIQAQLIASIRISPVHAVLGHLLRFAVPIGIVIAVAELAIGLGALLGLWTRLAAVGGLVLSLVLFLTVSFHSSPYYTGADIVFVFAWVPLILAGSGGVLSVDGLIASRVAAERSEGPPTVVPIRFELVQRVCGHYHRDTCTALEGNPCSPFGCPFLTDERGSIFERGPDAVDRRTLVLGGTAVAASALVGGVAAAAAAGLGRAVGGTTSA
jgi:thiosulfate dehydrogenase [quinone] large subunit